MESAFVVLIVAGGDAQIVVAAKIDVIVGRIAVLIDIDVQIQILVGRGVFLHDLAGLLCFSNGIGCFDFSTDSGIQL